MAEPPLQEMVEAAGLQHGLLEGGGGGGGEGKWMSLGARDNEVDRMMEATFVSGQKLGSLVSEGHPHLLASHSPYPPRPSFPPSPTHLEQARYL